MTNATVRIPSKLLPDVLNLLTVEYGKIADANATLERKLSEAQFALAGEKNKRKAYEAQAKELEAQLADDDF